MSLVATVWAGFRRRVRGRAIEIEHRPEGSVIQADGVMLRIDRAAGLVHVITPSTRGHLPLEGVRGVRVRAWAEDATLNELVWGGLNFTDLLWSRYRDLFETRELVLDAGETEIRLGTLRQLEVRDLWDFFEPARKWGLARLAMYEPIDRHVEQLRVRIDTAFAHAQSRGESRFRNDYSSKGW